MVFTQRNFDWWCERGILALVLASLTFAPLAFGAVYVWTFLVLQVLAMGVAGLWLARLWGGHKPMLLWPPIAWVVVAFLLFALARYLTSDIEYVGRLELLRLLLYGFMLLAVMSNLYDQDATEAITYTLTAVAVLAASYGVGQFCHHSNRVWNLTAPYPGRGMGTFINPDHFAGFLELVLPLALAFVMVGRVSTVARIILTYAVVTIMAGLAVTFSRGGWAAGAAGVLVLLGLLMCHRNHRLRAILVLLVAAAIIGGVTKFYLSESLSFKHRMENPETEQLAVVDADSRLQTWDGAYHMWQNNLWLGVGPGQFDYRYRQYRPPALQVRPEHAHNDYLELLDEFGVAGGLIILVGAGIFVFGLVQSWPHVRRAENDFGSSMSNRYAFFLGAAAGLCAVAVHSLVDFNLHVPADALTVTIIVGLAAANLRHTSKRYWIRARLPIQCAATVVLGGFIVYFALQTRGRAGEMIWSDQAEVLPPYSDAQAAALEKALAYEPQNFLTAYNIGECYRMQCWDDGENYAELAQKALKYYELGARLNPFFELCPLRYGMCLDKLGRHKEAEKYLLKAETLDPNGNWVVSNIGWHYLQVGDYAAARQWFIRAVRLSNVNNDMAKSSLRDVCEPKLNDRASGRLPIQLFYHQTEKDN